jgi:hypothetical protein
VSVVNGDGSHQVSFGESERLQEFSDFDFKNELEQDKSSFVESDFSKAIRSVSGEDNRSSREQEETLARRRVLKKRNKRKNINAAPSAKVVAAPSAKKIKLRRRL